MGITNLLPQLSQVSHKINLSELHEIEVREPPLKRCKASVSYYKKRRKIRVAIDISAWIASACHGNGAELLDERHFSNYGRTELLREHEQSKKKDINSSKRTENIKAENNVTETSNSGSLQVEQVQLFITRAENSVLRKVSSVQACLSSEVLVVFDGDTPPLKRTCCEERKKKRDDAASRRDQVLGSPSNPINLLDDEDMAENDAILTTLKKISAAKKAGAHKSEIYTAVVTSLLKTLREKRIPFLVSPYEADGQLAYLSKEGLVDLIISEDSDFVGHGAKAVLYKYKEVYIPYGRLNPCEPNNREATGVLIRRNDLKAKYQSFDLSEFTDVMLTVLCIAAGCDYCKSLRGIGIKTAKTVVKEAFQTRTDTPKLKLVFDALFKASHETLSRDEMNKYMKKFLAALIMFRHPAVFDPINVKLDYSNYDSPDPELMTYEQYAAIIHSRSKMEEITGKLYCKKMALNVVEGYINPKTWSLVYSESESPKSALEALKRWNTDTYEIEHDEMNRGENDKGIAMSSQSSGATSSASKLSSQTSNRSSNISVLSPNLLG